MSVIQPISFKQLLLEYRVLLGVLFAIITAVTGLSLAIPNLTGEVIKTIETGSTNWSLIWQLGSVVIALFFMEIIQVVVGAFFREKVGFNMREKLMEKVTTQNYSNVNKIGIGQIITLFGSDANNIKDIMAGELVLSVKAILLFIGALIILFVTNWKLGLIAFISLPIIVLSFVWIFKQVTKYFTLSQNNQTDLNNAISQNIYGANLVRVQNSQKWETQKFNFLTDQSKQISFKIIDAFSALIPIINTISNWTTFGILYFGALTYLANEIKLGDINAYLTYYALLTAPIFILGFNSQGIARIGVSIKRVNELLGSNEEIHTGTYNKPIKKGITLRNINLEFEGKHVLKNINLTIPIGTKTAILGPTGAGKSLLITLMMGMSQPTNGEVLLDGRPLHTWSQEFVSDQITAVFQESLIFSGDLMQNVVLNRTFNKEKYEKAIQTATLETLVKTKGDISELGGNLSGGQKQRLTLARALYNSPQMVLLDDFTARVDKKTEDKIQKLISQNYPQTTIVSVSQNIETIKNYDQIVLIMEGEILMSGTHKELIKNSPEYRQILASQQTVE